MTDPLIISLSPEAVQLLRNAPAWPARMRAAMIRATDLQNELTVGHIQSERLTGTGPFPVEQGKLGVVTNRLRGSVRPAKATASGMTINSSIGTNVVYAGAHEFGFSGSVTVRAHTRTDARFDVLEHRGGTGTRLALGDSVKTAGGNLKSGVKKIASGVVTVREHTADLNIPARAPIRRGINDRLSDYGSSLSTAVVESFRLAA